MNSDVQVIATTISGSIGDWAKVKRIIPLFAERGRSDVALGVARSHAEARAQTREVVVAGARTVISAGGSGTFNAVLEGCCDSGVPLSEVRLGFLRKGSADLIGKALGMPDEIESAVRVFAEALEADRTVPCDVLLAKSGEGNATPRHFVGYGGAEIMGRIPRYTETRFMKWYKGILSQLFGDLGPFMTGLTLATLEKAVKRPFLGRRPWTIEVDGSRAAAGSYQAFILVNGYLGPDLPWSDDALGSGRFHLFALEDQGLLRLPGQIRRARRARGEQAQGDEPGAGREGGELQHFTARDELVLAPEEGGLFSANVDGSTFPCRGRWIVQRVARIHLLAAPGRE